MNLDWYNMIDKKGAVDFSQLPHASELINDIGTVVFNGVEVFHNLAEGNMLGTCKFNWSTNPSRAKTTFAFENMDEIDVGLTYYLELNLKYLNIKDYYRLRKVLMQRHFYVTFFSKDDMDFVTREMYLDDKDAKQLYVLNEKLIGVFDYSITLIGTNNDLTSADWDNGQWKYGDDLSLRFMTNDPLHGLYAVRGDEKTITCTWGDQVKLSSGDGIIPPTDYHIEKWYTLNSANEVTGWYGLNQSTTIFKAATFYPFYKHI